MPAGRRPTECEEPFFGCFVCEPKAPQKGPTADDSSNGFNAKFFVELSLPQHGTTVMAEGRWVNTYRDDSGYGQSDTQLSSATLSLTWNAAAAKFER